MLAAHLPRFEPPQGPHDPAGAWQLDYRVYCLAALSGVGGQAGSVRLSRKPLGDDAFVLQVEYRKPIRQGRFAGLVAEVEARAALLPEPRRWTWTSEIPGVAPGAPPLSRLTRSAVLEGGVLKFSDSGRKIAVDGPCTINWLLLEAVGRLPRKAFPPLRFTLLEDFDRPKPHHALRYADAVSLMLADPQGRAAQPLRLHVYQHLGDGNVPWVYWVDDQGRLLFAVSGFEAYVLNHFAKS
jgi:hypothetical protein